MMKTISIRLYGVNRIVKVDMHQETFFDTDSGYEIYIATDGTWIAYDNAINDYVQIRR